jgi:phosphoacetylglucosamine mutase
VYFFVGEKKQMQLLDGDRQIALCAIFFAEQLAKAGITDLNIGTVQTAYANGASTKYIKEELKVPCFYAKTGVKYLHHKAVDFDIGIYYEANGHGTVIFKKEALEHIRRHHYTTAAQRDARDMLLAVSELAHQAVGDAIGDMLMIEAILALKDWSLADWASLYTDLPSKMDKVVVADRTQITTNDDETQCLEPEGLQVFIDAVVARYPGGRSFVRPSGTEDIVRVFAEASSEEEANSLAMEVMQLVWDNAGGVGSRPQ